MEAVRALQKVGATVFVFDASCESWCSSVAKARPSPAGPRSCVLWPGGMSKASSAQLRATNCVSQFLLTLLSPTNLNARHSHGGLQLGITCLKLSDTPASDGTGNGAAARSDHVLTVDELIRDKDPHMQPWCGAFIAGSSPQPHLSAWPALPFPLCRPCSMDHLRGALRLLDARFIPGLQGTSRRCPTRPAPPAHPPAGRKGSTSSAPRS